MSIKITPNEYRVEQDRAIFATTHGTEFVVDIDDVPKITPYHWFISSKGYVQTMVRKNGRRQHIRLHRFITDCPADMVVDHINHDILDNRKSNLRVCTQDENIRNRKPDKVSKSGIKGVYPENGKWRAMISYNRKQYRLGTFSTLAEAVKARQEAELKFYGDFANIQEVAI